MQKVAYIDWGRIGYQEAWDRQTALHRELVEIKRGRAASRGLAGYFILCDHPPVYTLGKSGKKDHLLLDDNSLRTKGIEFFKINRGGDITYHGPGQIVGYPILDLDHFFTDVHRYVRTIEEVIIRMLDDYGIEGRRIKEYTGVWLPEKNGISQKICAIGVHLSRWVSMHGFALNVNTDLSFFNHIVPCGIDEQSKAVSSMQQQLGHEVDKGEVKEKLRNEFAELFGCEIVTEHQSELN